VYRTVWLALLLYSTPKERGIGLINRYKYQRHVRVQMYVNFCLHDVTSKDTVFFTDHHHHHHHHHHHRQYIPYLSLEDSARLHPVFTSFDFVTIFYTARLLALRLTSNLEDQVSVLMPSSDRVAHLYPQARSSLFVAFYDSQGYGGGTLTRLHSHRHVDPKSSDGKSLFYFKIRWGMCYGFWTVKQASLASL
jgi:hypothetical protein